RDTWNIVADVETTAASCKRPAYRYFGNKETRGNASSDGHEGLGNRSRKVGEEMSDVIVAPIRKIPGQ
ncbi:hypothetical protein WA026_009487, partial [Henosepilachna vigintioctopunctata]